MKTTFAVSMTLLVAAVLGGGLLAYHNGTAEPAEASASAPAATAAAPTAAAPTAAAPSTTPTATASAPAASTGSTAVAPSTPATGTPTTTAGVKAAAAQAADNAQSSGASAGAGTQPGQNGNSTTPAQALAAADVAHQAAANGAPVAPTTVTNSGDAAAGKLVFASVGCQGCHGEQGQGVIGPALTTADGPKGWTLAQFTTTLREGQTPTRMLNTTMPRFAPSQVSDTDIANVQAYIKTLN